MKDESGSPTSKDCNSAQLDEFLRSDHYRIENQDLIDHLDRCDDCRIYLEEQAADSELWTKLENHLKPTDFDIAGDAHFSAATIDQFGQKPVAVSEVLNLLNPSDDPHHLGRLGNYEITGVVGIGGMGVVLKAIDSSLDRVVAIKVLAPQMAHNDRARQRFSREAKAAAAVIHPNVIPIHSVSSDGPLPYLVMAYIRGGSLQKRLENSGPLDTIEVLRIGSQIAAGLAAAHEQGLVHRDIKPENVLMEDGIERITITDFGLARAVDDNTVTQQGTIAGTPMYMSPEQARGEQLDQRSDLFSLGSVLYSMSCGKPPFHGDSSLGVMRMIIDEEPQALAEINPDVPDWLANVIANLMAKNKNQRYESAGEVHKLLEQCLNHLQQDQHLAESTTPEFLRHLAKKKSPSKEKDSSKIRPALRKLAPLAALALLVIFGGIFGFWMISPPSQNNSGTLQQAASAEKPKKVVAEASRELARVCLEQDFGQYRFLKSEIASTPFNSRTPEIEGKMLVYYQTKKNETVTVLVHWMRDLDDLDSYFNSPNLRSQEFEWEKFDEVEIWKQGENGFLWTDGKNYVVSISGKSVPPQLIRDYLKVIPSAVFSGIQKQPLPEADDLDRKLTPSNPGGTWKLAEGLVEKRIGDYVFEQSQMEVLAGNDAVSSGKKAFAQTTYYDPARGKSEGPNPEWSCRLVVKIDWFERSEELEKEFLRLKDSFATVQSARIERHNQDLAILRTRHEGLENYFWTDGSRLIQIRAEGAIMISREETLAFLERIPSIVGSDQALQLKTVK